MSLPSTITLSSFTTYPTSASVTLFGSSTALIHVTQTGAAGSVLTARSEESGDGSKASYAVETVLGRRDDPLLGIYARQLVEKGGEITPGVEVVLTISLKEEGRGSDVFEEVVNGVLAGWRDLVK